MPTGAAIVCALAFVVAWGLAAWQNERVLDIMNAPLPHDIEPAGRWLSALFGLVGVAIGVA